MGIPQPKQQKIVKLPFGKKRNKLRMRGVSDTSVLKEEIQRLVREIVIKRDGGCIFRKEKGHVCSGYANDGHLVLQADHLISRGNSETFADTRLIVCVCKGIHGWKSVGANLRKAEYDKRVKKLISKERLELWNKCEKNRFNSYRMSAYDWKLEICNLKSELKDLVS
jgi:hypothetical protein